MTVPIRPTDQRVGLLDSVPRRPLLQDLGLFLVLGALGAIAANISIRIPHTEAFLEVRFLFGFMAFALLSRWWLGLVMAAVLSVVALGNVPLWFAFLGNMSYALPALLVIRLLHGQCLRRLTSPVLYGLGWFALVVFCYEAFSTPIVWGFVAWRAGEPILPKVLSSWGEQPYLEEMLVTALISAPLMVAIRMHATVRRGLEELTITLDSIGDAVVATDPAGRITRMNPVAEQLTGWSLTDARGKPLEEVFRIYNARTGEPVDNPVQRVLTEGKTVGLANHTCLVSRDGTRLQIADSAAPIRESGQIVGTVMVFRDVTEEYRNRELLHQANEVMVRSPAATFVWENQPGRPVTFVSGNVQRVLGWPGSAFLADRKPFADVIHPEDADRVAGELARAVQNPDAQEVPHSPYRIVQQDGQVCWVEDRTTIRRDGQGHAFAFEGVLLNVTGRVEAEQRLRQREAMLRRTERIARVGSWEWDVATDTVTWSDELYRFFGRDPSEGTVSFAEHDKLYPPEDLARLRQAVQQTLEDGSPYELELRAKRNEDQLFHCIAAGHPERDAEGNVVRLVGSFQDISELKKAQEAYGKLCEMASELICVADINTATFTQVNPAFTEVLGYSEAELLGRSFLEFLHPDDVERTKRVIEEQLRKGQKLLSFQNRYRCKDGSYRWLDWNSHPIAEEGLTYAIAHDVTERKRSEQALRESEERFRVLVESAPVSILAVQEGKYVFGNAAGARMMGFDSAEQFAGLDVLDTIAPEHRDLVRQRMARIHQADGNEPVELKLNRTDGSTGWSLSSSVPVQIDGKKTALVVGQDITEHKRVRQALDEAQNLLETAIAQAPVGFVFADAPEGTIRLANPAALGIRGGDGRLLTGIGVSEHSKSWQTYRPDGTEYPSEELPLSRAVLYGEETRDAEVLIRDEQGNDHWVIANASPVRDADGNVTAGIVVFLDVTARKQAEADREHLQQRLNQSQRLESIGRLAGGVAHDFNNKLQAILGYVDLLLSDVGPGHPFRADLQEIRQAANQAANLTRQLLAFARKQTIDPKTLDLNETVEGLLKMLHRLIGEDIDLLWKPGEDVWPVRMDPTQVDQVLANLVVNARDAIADVGKITIETFRAEFDQAQCADHAGLQPGQYAVLAVSDDGEGMDAGTLGQVFEPFFTTKSQDQGTGLGLATVYGIVRQNGGFVNVYSEPGQGTTFRIYLPRAETEIDRVEPNSSKLLPRSGHETVLVVEDEQPLLALTEQMLRQLGYTVIAAASPAEAIELARKHDGAIDVLLTDVVMPEMNGRDLFGKLQPLCSGLRSVFMSGYTANVIAHRGVLDEGVCFLQKPFTIHSLAEQLRQALR